METNKLEAIYRVFPFLKGYTRDGDDVSIEESPGKLGNWKARKKWSDYYGEYSLEGNFRLLDKDGGEVLQVGIRQVWHPPKKFLWFWTIAGETKPEIFTETVAEALLRAQVPICYVLMTYPAGTSFILYKPPTGKTIEEWAQEKDRQYLEDCRKDAAQEAIAKRQKEEEVEAAIQAEADKLLEKIKAIDCKANPQLPVEDAPDSLIN